MRYETTRFGWIEVQEDKVMTFPEGIIGYEDRRVFVILKHKPDSSFYWLQSLEKPELAFSLLFPFEFVPDYAPKLSSADLEKMGKPNPSQLEFYCMVVIPKDPRLMTINLLSPLVVHSEQKKAYQIVLQDPSLSVTHSLLSLAQSSPKAV